MQRAVLSSVLRVEVLPNVGRGRVWTPERLRQSPVVEGIEMPQSALAEQNDQHLAFRKSKMSSRSSVLVVSQNWRTKIPSPNVR